MPTETVYICHCCKDERERQNAKPRELVPVNIKGLRKKVPLNLCPFCDAYPLDARVKNLSSPRDTGP